MSQTTLRAKSDGTEIKGALVDESGDTYDMVLAQDVPATPFSKSLWDKVPELPTEPGTIFEAEVNEVGTAQLSTYLAWDGVRYALLTTGAYIPNQDIDVFTIRIGTVTFA